MGRKRDMVVVGTAKPQMRQRQARDWSQAKAREFLSVLAETCNVSEACRQSGISVTSAYRRRKNDASFRAAWIEAVGAAYQRLELVLLERAFLGTEKVITRRDGSEERMTEYSNQLGLTLLKMHRDTAVEGATEFQPQQIEELQQRLVSKFQRIEARNRRERESE